MKSPIEIIDIHIIYIIVYHNIFLFNNIYEHKHGGLLMKKTIDLDSELIQFIMEFGVRNKIYDFSKAIRFFILSNMENNN